VALGIGVSALSHSYRIQMRLRIAGAVDAPYVFAVSQETTRAGREISGLRRTPSVKMHFAS
jgi:hypothetical protein